jgi:hypothetical protein
VETEEQQLKKVKRKNLKEAEEDGGSLLIPPDISRISQPGRYLPPPDISRISQPGRYLPPPDISRISQPGRLLIPSDIPQLPASLLPRTPTASLNKVDCSLGAFSSLKLDGPPQTEIDI